MKLLITAFLITLTSFAGVDDSYQITKNAEQNKWNVECSNGNYELRSTNEILNDQICGSNTLSTRECYENTKKTLSTYDLDTEVERFRLVKACSNITRSELECFEFVRSSLSIYGLDDLFEVEDTLNKCSGVAKKDIGCAKFITEDLSKYQYDSREEIFGIINKCKTLSI